MKFPSPLRAALAACLLPVGLAAQSLHGRVTDAQGLPVPGTKVEVAGTGRHAWTDSAGSYAIPAAPAGEQTLRALHEDFEPVAAQVQIPSEGQTRHDLRFEQVRRSVASVEVIGESVEAVQEIPGSVFLVSKEELQLSKPIDANEVLRRVPGINLREDSGPMAMRLNIGMRGLNPDRSRKVLMLEDGIPMSLAPYGEPEMYYSPPIDRMRRVEVLKGSGQIAHGPQTVGGVINFVTPDPPPKTHGDFDFEGGQRGFFAGQGSLGGSNRDQSAGWFVNYLHKRGDGWRNFFFNIDDVQAKFTLKPNDRHTFAVKAGLYDEGSNSTYLGLTQPMFEQDPNQNPVPSDFLKVERRSASLQHTMTVSPNAIWNNTVFAYHTLRNWSRQDWDRADLGRDYLDVAGDPSVPGGAVFLRDSAGNRNRSFNVFGIQSGASVQHQAGGVRGDLDVGVRYIYEDAKDQRINGEGFDARTGVVRDDEDRFGRAFSAYVQNKFYLSDRVIFTPGIRLEHYTQERHILRTRVRTPEGNLPTNVNRRNETTITKAVPGLGISFRATEAITFFTGVHRGFAPPRTKIAITNDGESLDLDAELSWNYEAGVRVQASRAFRGEFTYFRMDFENQIITAAESGGATTTLVNGGETLHEGFETSFRVNWDEFFPGSWLVYTELRQMHLATAEFSRNNLFAGNRLPYAPENTFGFILGVRQREGLGFQIDMNFVGDQFGDNNETIIPSADGTVGPLPSYQTWNLVLDYTVRRERFEFTPYFTVKNLFDELYIASRAPQGIQPGLFRQANLGIRFSF